MMQQLNQKKTEIISIYRIIVLKRKREEREGKSVRICSLNSALSETTQCLSASSMLFLFSCINWSSGLKSNMSVSVVCVAAVIVVKTWPANSLLFGSKDSFKKKRGVEKNRDKLEENKQKISHFRTNHSLKN